MFISLFPFCLLNNPIALVRIGERWEKSRLVRSIFCSIPTIYIWNLLHSIYEETFKCLEKVTCNASLGSQTWIYRSSILIVQHLLPDQIRAKAISFTFSEIWSFDILATLFLWRWTFLVVKGHSIIFLAGWGHLSRGLDTFSMTSHRLPLKCVPLCELCLFFTLGQILLLTKSAFFRSHQLPCFCHLGGCLSPCLFCVFHLTY